MVTQLGEMMARHARNGRVVWIGLRAERRAEIDPVERAQIGMDGLERDHAGAGKRAVTLIQSEHLPVIAALLGQEVAWPQLRRNIVIEGVNLAAFRKRRIKVGEAILSIEGPCPPCSRMEEALGHGGYSAMRGHGGFYASVVGQGQVAVGDVAGPV